MDFNATIDLIIKDLDEARQIIDDLKKYPGVPSLQVELAKAKCKSAGDVISLLKSHRDNIPEVREESFENSQQSQQVIPEETESTASSFIANLPIDDLKENSLEVKEIYTLEELKKEAHANENTELPVAEKEESKKSQKKAPDSPILADKFSHMSNRFNEQLGSKSIDDDVSDILKTKPLSNLSEAIGVNDKFLFLREIFDGNKEAYTQAIAQLDNATTLKDAMAVIMSYTGDNDENKAVKQLLDLVKRKLPSNE